VTHTDDPRRIPGVSLQTEVALQANFQNMSDFDPRTDGTIRAAPLADQAKHHDDQLSPETHHDRGRYSLDRHASYAVTAWLDGSQTEDKG
jgi:hypothetical protein